MLFNSNAFLFVFLPIVVIIYWLVVRRSIPVAVGFLALASYGFLVYGEPTYPWLLAASILFNYICGLGIRRTQDPYARVLLMLGVVGDLLVLAVFKYANFFAGQVAMLFRSPIHPSIVLPLGISFYTFTQIAYLVDTYQTRDSESHLVRYFLFISYFPHLIAGPIIHHKEMMPQFLRPRLRIPQLSIYAGLCLFAIGLAKKVLIADPCGEVATSIFSPAAHGIRVALFDAWMAALTYTVQIYFDFSGYSDMALGISLMLGIRLPINFNSPYKSRNIIEFWRRWHISLSRFLRDYVYIALGGNRKGRARRYVNLLLTMVIGGIWHGAGWTFLMWGTLHGLALLLVQLWRDQVKNCLMVVPASVGRAATFLFVLFAWVPFRSPDFATMGNIWGGMVGAHGFSVPDVAAVHGILAKLHLPIEPAFFTVHQIPILLIGLVVAWSAPNSQQIMRKFRVGLDSPGYRALPPARSGAFAAGVNWKTAFLAGTLLALAARCIGSYSEFIYFHF
jgi:D-alanyl-lipoteichoic acid acyltransferase DltB (MBOAT superfamily)